MSNPVPVSILPLSLFLLPPFFSCLLVSSFHHFSFSLFSFQKESESKISHGYTIGIDLGSTYCRVGIYRNGGFELIPNCLENRSTPTFVSFGEKTRWIGEGAQSQSVLFPTQTLFDIRKLLGRRYSDSDVQDAMKTWPFKVIEKQDRPLYQIELEDIENNNNRSKTLTFTPEEIISMILIKLKSSAETYLGEPVSNVVIATPGYFGHLERQYDSLCLAVSLLFALCSPLTLFLVCFVVAVFHRAIKDAARIAGLSVLRLTSDSLCVGFVYGWFPFFSVVPCLSAFLIH
jgi:molecular chaperone DnaK (HSP70)